MPDVTADFVWQVMQLEAPQYGVSVRGQEFWYGDVQLEYCDWEWCASPNERIMALLWPGLKSYDGNGSLLLVIIIRQDRYKVLWRFSEVLHCDATPLPWSQMEWTMHRYYNLLCRDLMIVKEAV